MKRWIHAAEKAEAYDFYYNSDVRQKLFQAHAKAKKLLSDTNAYAVCYAVAFDLNHANELKYDADGCLFAASTSEEYQKKVAEYCDGRPEDLFEFYTVFNEDDKSADDVSVSQTVQTIYQQLSEIADQYPGMYMVRKGKDGNSLSITNYKYNDNYGSNHNTIYIWVSDNYREPLTFDEMNRSRREKQIRVRTDCDGAELNKLYSFVNRWAKRNQ